MSAAQEAAGAQLLIGTVTGVTTAAGAVTGVTVQQQQQHGEAAGSSSEVEVPADAVVLALGPWTQAARAWLPTAPEMSGVCSNTARMEKLHCSSLFITGEGHLAGAVMKEVWKHGANPPSFL